MSLSEAPCKILLIGDEQAARGLIRSLAGCECEVVATVDAALVRLREPGKLELVLWDTEGQARALDEAFDRRRYGAPIPTLLLLERLYPWVAAHGRRPGALDYLVKPVTPAELLTAVHANVRVLRARRALEEARRALLEVSAQIASTHELLGPTGFEPEGQASAPEGVLSEREEEIARLLAQGQRVSQIADKLGISPHTVRNHFKSVFRKLGVHSQIELLARMREARPGN